MSRFVLTAQLQLQAPNNIGQVVQQIQNQLQNVQVNVQVQGVQQANRQTRQLASNLDAASDSANRLGRVFAVSVRRFTALAVATRAVSLFTNTLSGAIQEAIDFERELIKVSQVTGRALTELRDLTDTITNLSTSLGVSSQSLLSVTTILAQAGLNANDTKIALDTLAKSALAPNFDSLSETTEGAIAILAQFKQGVGALEAQLGSIDAVAGAFAVEAGDLIDVVRRAGGVFKSSGGSLNELLALFTSVRATTRESAESIGTGLRTIFTRIQRPQTIEFLKQFGVELVNLEGKFVGPFEAVRRLSGALAGLGEGDLTFIRVAEELGGFRQIGKVLPLLQQFALAQEALNVAQEGGAGLAKNAISAQAALAVRITKVREEFLALVRSITETSSFQIMANTALNLASALIKIGEALKPVLPLLGALAAIKVARGLGSFLGGIGAGFGSARGFNQGGKVLAFAKGGLVPGSGNRDTVPAMLTPGEFVMKKSAVQSMGASNLKAMNRGGKASRKVDYEAGVGPSPFESAKSNKLGSDVYSLQKSSGLTPGEFEMAKRFADTNGYSLQEFKQYLAKRAQEKRNKAGLKTNTNDLLATLKGGEPPALSPENERLRVMLGGDPRRFAVGGIADKIKQARSQNIPDNPNKEKTKTYADGQKSPVRFSVADGSIGAFFMNKEGTPDGLKSFKAKSFNITNDKILSLQGISPKEVRPTDKNGRTLPRLAGDKQKFTAKGILEAGNIATFYPSIGDVKSGPLSQIVQNNVKTKLSEAVLSVAGEISSRRLLDIPPIDSNDALLSAAATRIQSDAGAIKTTSGYLYEGVIDALTGASPASGNAVFDFPASSLRGSRKRLAALFGNEAGISRLKQADAKASYSTKIIDGDIGSGSISSKIINSINNGVLAGINIKKKYLGGIIQKFARGGIANAPLVDDIPNATGVIQPRPSLAIARLLQAGGGAVDIDRTIKRTIGDKAFGSAKTEPQREAALQTYFRDDVARLRDVKTAPLTQFGQELQSVIKSGKLDGRRVSIISKSKRVPGITEYLSQLFGIPSANMVFTSGQSKQPAMEAIRTKGPRVDRVARFATGGVVPGSGNRDTVPAVLQQGDFVIRKSSVKKIGTDNLASMAGYATGGGVDKSVPALLTPGEFVFSKEQARGIGYGKLNRMNKVGKYATGGVVGAKKFARGGTATSGAASGNLLSGFGSQLTFVTAALQSMVPAINDNSSTITRLTSNLLSLATTIGGVIFAVESFGLSLNLKNIQTLLGSGPNSLGGTFAKALKGPATSFAEKRDIVRSGTQGGYRAGRQVADLGQAYNRKIAGIQSATGLDRVQNTLTSSFKYGMQEKANPLSTTGRFASVSESIQGGGKFRQGLANISARAGSVYGRAFRVGGQGANASGAISSVASGGGGITSVIGSFAKLAGPLASIVGSAALVSGAFNSLITSMYDYEGQIKKATEKGDVVKAGEIANKQYDLQSANTMRTAGATAGSAIGFVLGGPIGSAIGAAIGAGVATVFATVLPQAWQDGINVLFGGNTRASAVALAEAQAQAVKTSQALAEAQTTAEKSIKDFQDGTITAAQALDQVRVATQEVTVLQEKNQKAVDTNVGNRSEIGSGAIARNIGAYLGGGLFGMETAATRNARIDSENAQLIEGQKSSVLQANDIRKQAGLATARTSILSSVSAGKSRDEIRQDVNNQLGDNGPQAIRQQAIAARQQAQQALQRGDTETADAFKAQADALSKQAQQYEQSIDNLIKEQERLEKSLKALNLGVRGPASTAAAASAELEYFAAQLEGTALPAVNALSLLEASVTSAGSVIDKGILVQATNDVADTLSTLGASADSITKFKAISGALNDAQSSFSDIAKEIKGEQAASGTSFTPEEVRNRFVEKLGSLADGLPDELQSQFKDIVGGIELTDTIKDQIARGDYSGIADALGEQGKKFFEPLIKIAQDYQKAQQVLVNLTKERINAERNYVQAVKEAQDIMMEGREIQSKYGGKELTLDERRASVLTKANASNQLTGLGPLRSANVADLNTRSQEINRRFQQNQTRINGGEGAGTASGEQLRQQQQDLKQAQKDQVQTIRELIRLEEENLKLISEKNRLEKESADSLLTGNIEKFFEQQAAVGATAAIASGDNRLASMFGGQALGAAAQDIRRQQEAGVQSLYGRRLGGAGGLTETAFGTALGAAGVTDPRLAQVAAGTTAEEEASKARLRDLGGALGEAGKLSADLATIEVATATINIANAEETLQKILERGQAAGAFARGGPVYASRGTLINFKPRGTDTVPAMLTPGEFVVRREAVNRGNNLQLLEAINNGSANVRSGNTEHFAQGGQVQYYRRGRLVQNMQNSGSGGVNIGIDPSVLTNFSASLDNFNKQLSQNISNLQNTKFQIALSPTNINVNLTGTSFLASLTETIKKDLITFVGEEIRNYAVGNDGKLRRSGSTLGTVT